MPHTIRSNSLPAAFALALAIATPVGAQDTLQQVKELYASASYEAALDVLSRLQSEEQRLEISRYRAFCLIALERTSEAERAIQSILADDPSYTLDEAAPRVVEFFRRVKRQATPELARTLYSDGKSAMERKENGEAIRKFEQLLQLTDGSDVRDGVLVSELRLLAAGFLDLARAATPPVAPKPVAANDTVVQPARLAVVTRPVALQQKLPRWLPYDAVSKAAEYKGAIKVRITADGKVDSAEIVTPTDPYYDQQLLSAARAWLYVPAKRDGVAIRSEQIVEVHLLPLTP